MVRHVVAEQSAVEQLRRLGAFLPSQGDGASALSKENADLHHDCSLGLDWTSNLCNASRSIVVTDSIALVSNMVKVLVILALRCGEF